MRFSVPKPIESQGQMGWIGHLMIVFFVVFYYFFKLYLMKRWWTCSAWLSRESSFLGSQDCNSRLSSSGSQTTRFRDSHSRASTMKEAEQSMLSTSSLSIVLEKEVPPAGSCSKAQVSWGFGWTYASPRWGQRPNVGRTISPSVSFAKFSVLPPTPAWEGHRLWCTFLLGEHLRVNPQRVKFLFFFFFFFLGSLGEWSLNR